MEYGPWLRVSVCSTWLPAVNTLLFSVYIYICTAGIDVKWGGGENGIHGGNAGFCTRLQAATGWMNRRPNDRQLIPHVIIT